MRRLHSLRAPAVGATAMVIRPSHKRSRAHGGNAAGVMPRPTGARTPGLRSRFPTRVPAAGVVGKQIRDRAQQSDFRMPLAQSGCARRGLRFGVSVACGIRPLLRAADWVERLQTARWSENFAQNDRAAQILIRPELEQEALLLRGRAASLRARYLRAEIAHFEACFLHDRGREDPSLDQRRRHRCRGSWRSWQRWWDGGEGR